MTFAIAARGKGEDGGDKASSRRMAIAAKPVPKPPQDVVSALDRAALPALADRTWVPCRPSLLD